MQVLHCASPAEFLDRAQPFLTQHEALNTLPLGIAGNLLAAPPEAAYLAVVEHAGAVAAAAVRNATHNLALAWCDQPPALAALAEDLAARTPDLPGVVGPRPAAEAFGAHWHALTGQAPAPGHGMGVYELTQVRPPTGVAGVCRPAAAADVPELVAWRVAFSQEALGHTPDPAQAAEALSAQMNSPVRGVVVWEVDGRPVAMAGFTGPTPHGIRIGGVYTPPPLRGHGYASACVAALSQRLLDRGYRFCFLFTDLANPTANKIYQQIGYGQVGEALELRLTPAR